MHGISQTLTNRATLNMSKFILVLSLLATGCLAEQPLPLNLESLHGCVFHLVISTPSVEVAMVEGILHGNQYGQPWTVLHFWTATLNSITRGGAPHMRESRSCNVHLVL